MALVNRLVDGWDHGGSYTAAVIPDHEAPGWAGRILVHDYGGYPFIVQLSRELARRGHEVLHLYADGFRRPKGPMKRRADDPPSLSIAPVTLNEPLRPGGWRRLTQERRYGRRLADRIEAFRPDIVLSANAPLYVQTAAVSTARSIRASSVVWLQDLHSLAIRHITGRRIRMLGTLIGSWFGRIERRLLHEADGVVAISSTYLEAINEAGVPMEKVEVIQNWAPIDDAPPASKSNPWSRAHALDDRPTLLYAGTLALKHNPNLLLELARSVPGATVVVASEGAGADWLRAHGGGVQNLRILPFQPYDQVADMLASADVLLAVLERDASAFSVPSKILTYLAAGRPILAAIPSENPAAQAIDQAGAGTVVDPGDAAGLAAAARAMLADRDRLRSAGEAARGYADSHFAIAPIADRFEDVIASALKRRAGGANDG
ncbi:MAG: glycosyltransferase family 4 protein [Chloroflexota bacterium]